MWLARIYATDYLLLSTISSLQQRWHLAQSNAILVWGHCLRNANLAWRAGIDTMWQEDVCV